MKWTPGSRIFRNRTTDKPPPDPSRIRRVTKNLNLMPWHRVRLGYPFAAITTDTQLEQRIFQLWWQGYPFLANLGMGSALGFVAGCIVATMKRNRELRKDPGEDVFPDT